MFSRRHLGLGELLYCGQRIDRIHPLTILQDYNFAQIANLKGKSTVDNNGLSRDLLLKSACRLSIHTRRRPHRGTWLPNDRGALPAFRCFPGAKPLKEDGRADHRFRGTTIAPCFSTRCRAAVQRSDPPRMFLIEFAVQLVNLHSGPIQSLLAQGRDLVNPPLAPPAFLSADFNIPPRSRPCKSG